MSVERIAVDDQQIGERALLDHAELAWIGIARTREGEQLARSWRSPCAGCRRCRTSA